MDVVLLDGKNQMNNDDFIDGIGKERSDLTNSLIEFGKKAITDSITVINDFIKMMIPLTTGLITAYFALLEFLNVKTILDTNAITKTQLIDPTMFMLYSLVAFIVTSFPVFWKFDIGNIPSISTYRYIMIGWRYIGAAVGMGLFLYGVYLMIQIVGTIIIKS